MISRFARTFAFALLLSACGGGLSYDVRGTELSPGADGHLKAKIDAGRVLTHLEFSARNLAPANRILDGGTTYVVWARRDSSVNWTRLGALELTEEGRSGSAKLSTAQSAFDFLVSAETTPDAASPSGKNVFAQRVEN